ncbi:MAG: FHA domain-containing protein [Thermoguttaceae bacterium]
MSLVRLVYYSTMVGGWAALIGWGVFEILFSRSRASDTLLDVMSMAIVGAAIGAGINLVAGLVNGQWWQLLGRALPGLVCGGLGGACGGLIGHRLYTFGRWAFLGSGDHSSWITDLLRACGWLVAGLAIGVVDGIYEHSSSKIRNGLIGGCIGGLLGGLLLHPIQQVFASQSGMSSRAVSFVILGMCIGALVGLVQMVLKEAWLTVLDGYRAGRQLILSQPVTTLGRAEHLALPFIGMMNREIEWEHLKITRQTGGRFVLEDNRSRLGTRLNNQPVQGPTPLKDGDVIKFGTNFVRFNERHKRAGQPELAPSKAAFSGRIAPPPPPPIRSPASGPPPISGTAPPKRDASSPQWGGIAPPPPPKRT